MKKFLKIFLPIVLSITILIGIGWYLFSYDKGLTQDILMSCGRFFAKNNNIDIAAKFYDWAYMQDHDRDAVALELAEMYIDHDNYTKAEVALNRAIRDNANADVYIALSKTYVAQDKVYDAVELLNGITDQKVKEAIDAQRPAKPTTTMEKGPFNALIPYSVSAEKGLRLYVNPDGEYPSVKKHLYTDPITLKEGENVLYAVAISDSGLVSPLEIFKPTVNGVIEPITFQDGILETHIRTLLNIPAGQTVYSNQLWNISELTVPEGVARYDDIRYMIHLESLTIENGVADQFHRIDNNLDSFQDTLKTLVIRNTVLSEADLELISQLTNLENLTLSECSLSTTTYFENLKNITNLDLSYNSIRNLSAIANMPELKSLNLQRNAIEDLSLLSGCKKLETVNVADNLLTSMEPLANIPGLKELNISNNKLTHIRTLSQLQNLTKLEVSHNTITDITPLKDCLALTSIDISENQITDLSPLALLIKMEYLDFSKNQVQTLPQWKGGCALVTIDGSNNLISDLTPLGTLKNINNILMDYNAEIQSVECLAQCPVLIKVNIYGTKVVDVSMLTEQSIIVNYNPLETPPQP